MSAIKGDFTGFTFNGIHSSELGLTRVSDGNRYNENLLPTIQDKTVQIPGRDGMYFFGSFYTQRTFNISVAFDNMTEEQFVKIKQVFGDKKIHDLIFDEMPYKIYRVKSTGTPNLKYICFNKDIDEFDRDYTANNEIWSKDNLYGIGSRSSYGRLYKGEGTLNFVSYQPFARSRFKYSDEYTMTNIPEWGSMDTASADDVHYNLYDWINSVNLKRSDSVLIKDNVSYQIDKGTLYGVAVYNPGDFPVNFELTFLYSSDTSQSYVISSPNSSDFDNYLIIDSFDLKQNDQGVRINGKLNLIEGIFLDTEKTKYKKVTNVAGKNPREEKWYWLDDSVTPSQWKPAWERTPINGRTYYIRIPYFSPTGNIYNEYIIGGDFFKIPITKNLIWLPITSFDGSVLGNYSTYIKYDYLFY